MSRSYKKQPIWKFNRHGMKKIGNHKVRQALKSDLELDLKNCLYKRYFCSWEIYDYAFLQEKTFEEYYRRQVAELSSESRDDLYKRWIACRRK